MGRKRSPESEAKRARVAIAKARDPKHRTPRASGLPLMPVLRALVGHLESPGALSAVCGGCDAKCSGSAATVGEFVNTHACSNPAIVTGAVSGSADVLAAMMPGGSALLASVGVLLGREAIDEAERRAIAHQGRELRALFDDLRNAATHRTGRGANYHDAFRAVLRALGFGEVEHLAKYLHRARPAYLRKP